MRRTDSTRGSAATEFAIILLPFCMLLMGMIDYGWYFLVDLACTNAVREGARVAATYPGLCGNATAMSQASSATQSYLSFLPYSVNPTVTCTNQTNGVANFAQYTVQVDLTFPQLTGFSYIALPGGGYGGSVTVQTSATMRN